MGQMQSRSGCCGLAKSEDERDVPILRRHGMATSGYVDYNVPPVLSEFLAARQEGDVERAVACCTDDMIMRGPMGQFVGIEAVKAKAFNKPSQPLGNVSPFVLRCEYPPRLLLRRAVGVLRAADHPRHHAALRKSQTADD